MVSAGANLLGYGVQSQFIPHWFVRRRGLAIGIAFAGVGAGSIILLPWMQILIARDGWRWACLAFALIAALLLFPLNLLLRKRPQEIGLHPDGDAAAAPKTSSGHASNVVDTAWASVNWTLARAARTARFWWIGLGYFAILYAWYAVQVHQTKYLTEIGVSQIEAARALCLVRLAGVARAIVFCHLSARIGRRYLHPGAAQGAGRRGPSTQMTHNAALPSLVGVLYYVPLTCQNALCFNRLPEMGSASVSEFPA